MVTMITMMMIILVIILLIRVLSRNSGKRHSTYIINYRWQFMVAIHRGGDIATNYATKECDAVLMHLGAFVDIRIRERVENMLSFFQFI